MEYNENRAIYLQIADVICENILREKWKAGERIPSIREMAVSMEVNPNTVLRTYNYLQNRGIIYNRRGIGYYIGADARDKTLRLKRDEFIRDELPRLFRMMELLDIDFNELERLYNEHSGRSH